MAFMLIGMLSLEGVMLGDGLMFAFNIPNTLTSKLIMYIIFGILWVLFSLFGAKVVAIIAKIAVPLYAIFLVIVLVKVLAGASFSATIAKTVVAGPIAPGQWALAINATLGVAGLMALLDADYTRFAKKDSHMIPFALTGAIIQDFIMIALGGLLAFAGYDKALAYYHSIGLTGSAAVQAAMSNPGVVFVLYGGIAGGILIFLSQSKAQAMNSYDGSLSFSNFLATLFNWKPGRMWSVIIVNIIAIIFIFGGVLNLVSQFLTIGSDICGVWATIIATDYLFVRGVLKIAPKQIENLENIPSINWVGFLTFVVASLVSMWLFYANIVLVPFVVGVPLAFLLYVIGTLGTKGSYIVEKSGEKHNITIG
jgi:cytosine permease